MLIYLQNRDDPQHFLEYFSLYFTSETGHSLDDKRDGHLISRELQSLTKPLGVMTDLANSLTAEYKKNFNLLF